MKLTTRGSTRKMRARTISAAGVLDPTTGQRVATLSFIDGSGFQRHFPTTVDLAKFVGGRSEPGEPVDSLARLLHHNFTVHLNDKDKAVGLDIIPSRQYRAGVVPTSQLGVTTVVVRYELGGAVARITQRPPKFSFDDGAILIAALDAAAAAKKAIAVGMSLGKVGKVVSVTDDSVEVRMRKGAAPTALEDDDGLVDG